MQVARKLSSASAYAARPSSIFEAEPPEEWKTNLRDRIAQNLAEMVTAAESSLADDIEADPSTSDQRSKEHKDTIDNIRKMANEEYQNQLEQERWQRRWANQLPLPPGSEELLEKKESALLESIVSKSKRHGKQPESRKRAVSESVGRAPPPPAEPSHRTYPPAASSSYTSTFMAYGSPSALGSSPSSFSHRPPSTYSHRPSRSDSPIQSFDEWKSCLKARLVKNCDNVLGTIKVFSDVDVQSDPGAKARLVAEYEDLVAGIRRLYDHQYHKQVEERQGSHLTAAKPNHTLHSFPSRQHLQPPTSSSPRPDPQMDVLLGLGLSKHSSRSSLSSSANGFGASVLVEMDDMLGEDDRRKKEQEAKQQEIKRMQDARKELEIQHRNKVARRQEEHDRIREEDELRGRGERDEDMRHRDGEMRTHVLRNGGKVKEMEFQRREQEILQRRRERLGSNAGTVAAPSPPPGVLPNPSVRPPHSRSASTPIVAGWEVRGQSQGVVRPTPLYASATPSSRRGIAVAQTYTPAPVRSGPSTSPTIPRSFSEAEWRKRQMDLTQQQKAKFQAEQGRLSRARHQVA